MSLDDTGRAGAPGHVLRILDGITLAANVVGSCLIVALVILITADVLGRNLLGAPVAGVPEIVSLSIVAIVFLQAPQALRAGRLTRSDGVIDVLKTRAPRVAAGLETLFDLTGIAVLGAILHAHWPIMTRAWEILRCNFGGKVTRHKLRMALEDAWMEAKMAVKRATESDEVRTFKDSILCIESKSRITERDYEELRSLRAALGIAQKRALIESAAGRFASVVFTKKDGSQREMRVQPAKLKFHVKGSAASEAAQRAVETRKARHPHLLPVWDVEASAPRSVNLATVSRIAVDGAVHEYRV